MSTVEIVSRMEPRRKWSAAEKAALLAEVDAEGGRVTLVARRHQISESLLYNWRSARKAAVAAATGIEPRSFCNLVSLGGPAMTSRRSSIPKRRFQTPRSCIMPSPRVTKPSIPWEKSRLAVATVRASSLSRNAASAIRCAIIRIFAPFSLAAEFAVQLPALL